MAKGRSHSGSRDDNSIANFDPLQDLLRPASLSPSLPDRVLDPITDLRIYNPTTQLLGPLEISRPAPYYGYTPARFIESAVPANSVSRPARTNRFGNVINSRSSPTRAVFGFQKPHRVPICIRRSQRREVLFAKRKHGRGNRKPRWNQRSYMRCS